jgi:hypothetical protein
MTPEETTFIKLAFIEQKPYSTIKQELQVTSKQLTEWSKKYERERLQIAAVKRLYTRKQITEMSWNDFHSWYTSQSRTCYYCGISHEQIQLLLATNNINTKRIITRGRSLELERVIANESYNNIPNLRLCCYWCNNAKSDEFTEEEFKPIAKAIAEVWKQRLKN